MSCTNDWQLNICKISKETSDDQWRIDAGDNIK